MVGCGVREYRWLIFLGLVVALAAGCGRPSKERCVEVCAHLESVQKKRIPRCAERCVSHGSESRARCLLAATTPAAVEACRAD